MVTIGTPSGAHLEPAVAAARAGKHVIVEKPLEITLAALRRDHRRCAQGRRGPLDDLPLAVPRLQLRDEEAIDSGRFGRLTVGDAYVKWYRTQEYYDSGAWRGTWELDGGGALMNQAIHSVDLLTLADGPGGRDPAQTAMLAHERIAVEDMAVATLRFANGALGVIEASTAIYPGLPEADRDPRLGRLGGDGGRGHLKWDFAKQATARRGDPPEDGPARRSGGGGAADPAAIGHHGHTRQFPDVLKAIQKGTAPPIDGPEGRRSVEIILAIYKAAETGRAVALPLKSDPALKARAKDKATELTLLDTAAADPGDNATDETDGNGCPLVFIRLAPRRPLHPWFIPIQIASNRRSRQPLGQEANNPAGPSSPFRPSRNLPQSADPAGHVPHTRLGTGPPRCRENDSGSSPGESPIVKKRICIGFQPHGQRPARRSKRWADPDRLARLHRGTDGDERRAGAADRDLPDAGRSGWRCCAGRCCRHPTASH